MGFSILSRLWPLIPKRLLIELVVAFCVYMVGIHHGRAPYKLAAMKQDARASVITKQTDIKHLKIDQKGIEANENTQNYDWVFDSRVAGKLSDILRQ